MFWSDPYRKGPKKHFGYFSGDDLVAITEAVRRAEAKTSGEIRIKIRKNLDPGVATVAEQAVRDFEYEGLLNTRERTGVLVLLVMNERQSAIRADKGIYEKFSQFY